MAQLFEPSWDTWLRVAVLAVAVAVVGAFLIGAGVVRSAWVTGLGEAPEQPVPFSHAHHVGGLGLDCRYCHDQVETAASAGYPPTYTCMSCHSQVWTGAPELAPVRRSLAEGEPLRWQRVYDLPDFVYFNHAIHVDRGVACTTCHGRVDQMPRIRQAVPLTMGWCLECHRGPADRLGEPDLVTVPTAPPPTPAEADERLAHFGIDPARLDHCYVCHR
jgi:DNA-directed RNA polymerase subunit RPC12/RpoP